jgi:hypothetical protein
LPHADIYALPNFTSWHSSGTCMLAVKSIIYRTYFIELLGGDQYVQFV